MKIATRNFSLSQRVAHLTVANHKILIMLATVVTLLLSIGILRTSFDTSLNALLTESDPYLDELELLSEEFPPNSEIRFAFIAKPGETVFTPAVLYAIAELKETFTTIPRIRGITTILEFTSPETQARLFSKPLEEYSTPELLQVSENARKDRLLTNNLLSKLSLIHISEPTRPY